MGSISQFSSMGLGFGVGCRGFSVMLGLRCFSLIAPWGVAFRFRDLGLEVKGQGLVYIESNLSGFSGRGVGFMGISEKYRGPPLVVRCSVRCAFSFA